MKINAYLKYGVRFLFLQVLLTYITIYYFDKFLIAKSVCEYCVGGSFRMQIDSNLWEDRNRFFTFIPEEYIHIDYFVGVFIFIFLIILYSTKFYTYVNELTFSLDRSYLDEFISIYLLWTSSLVTFVTIFRVSSLISRANLILLTFIIPLILLIFRNSEFLSSLLGRSITNESFITINLEEDSVFRNLRIATFREEIKRLDSLDIGDASKIISTIDKINKDEKIND